MKKQFLIASTLALSIPVALTFVSCSNTKTVEQSTISLESTSNDSTSNEDNYSTVTITYVPGEDQEGVTFIGGTVSKIRKGREFATTVAPIAMKDGFSNDYWLREDGSRVFNNDKITTNLTLHPFFSHDVKLGNCVGIAALEDSKVSIVTHGVGTKRPNLSYSTDGIAWTTYDPAIKSIIDVKAGATLYFRGNNVHGFSHSETAYTAFSIGGKVNINGNAMTLIDDGDGSTPDIPNDYCFFRLFESCSGIVSISSNFLPAKRLRKYCYAYMFYDCASLTHFPSTMLPVQKIYVDDTYSGTCCYAGMFMNCIGLTTIPAGLLPSGKNTDDTLGVYCYYGMFEGCENLTTVPSELLPSKTLKYGSYFGLFAGCKKLTSIANDLLPATTLAPLCYEQMFANCESLVDASNLDLPVQNLTGCDECYCQMFYNCTKLQKAPKLPATTLAPYCYSAMFYNCHDLTTLPDSTESTETTYFLPATNLSDCESCYRYMFYNCEDLATIPDLPATTLDEYCYSDMFHSCTTLAKTTVTSLPATTLAPHCYDSMFYNCSTMKAAFSLPENVTLDKYCCQFMYSNCTSLESTPALNATVAAEGCYYSMFSGCSAVTSPGRIYLSTWAPYACFMMFSDCKSFGVNREGSTQIIALPSQEEYEADDTIVGFMFQGTKGRETSGWSPYYSVYGYVIYAPNWYVTT